VARRKLPKKFRARSVSDDEKLAEARRLHRLAESEVFRAVGKLARARELVLTYERKLGLDARSAGLLELSRSAVKKGARDWLDAFGFDVPPEGGIPQKKAELRGFDQKVVRPGVTEYRPRREEP
jgi:hypothetical protein